MLRRAVWTVDKHQAKGRIQTMQDLVADNVDGDKVMVRLIGIFAESRAHVGRRGYLRRHHLFRDAANARNRNSSGYPPLRRV